MANLFNQDFIGFIDPLNEEDVEYILVGIVRLYCTVKPVALLIWMFGKQNT